MDQGTEFVAPSTSVCLPQDPLAPMSGVLEVAGRGPDDETPLFIAEAFTFDEDPGAPDEAFDVIAPRCPTSVRAV